MARMRRAGWPRRVISPHLVPFLGEQFGGSQTPVPPATDDGRSSTWLSPQAFSGTRFTIAVG